MVRYFGAIGFILPGTGHGDHHHHHRGRAPDWSVAISTSCLHRSLSWASHHVEFSPWLSGWTSASTSRVRSQVSVWRQYGGGQVSRVYVCSHYFLVFAGLLLRFLCNFCIAYSALLLCTALLIWICRFSRWFSCFYELFFCHFTNRYCVVFCFVWPCWPPLRSLVY